MLWLVLTVWLTICRPDFREVYSKRLLCFYEDSGSDLTVTSKNVSGTMNSGSFLTQGPNDTALHPRRRGTPDQSAAALFIYAGILCRGTPRHTIMHQGRLPLPRSIGMALEPLQKGANVGLPVRSARSGRRATHKERPFQWSCRFSCSSCL